MSRRGRMSSGHSKKQFRAGINNVHRLNNQKTHATGAMRGGIRL